MPAFPSDFTPADLTEWLDQAIDALSVQHRAANPGDGPLREHFAFHAAVAAGLCLGLPEASFLIVSAHIPAHLRANTSFSLPMGSQVFAAQVGETVLFRGAIASLEELETLAVELYEEELAIHGSKDLIPDIQPRLECFPPEQTPDIGFTKGAWPQFIADQLSTRRRAHQQATALDTATATTPPDTSPSPRSRRV